MNHDKNIKEFIQEIDSKMDDMCKGAEVICDQIFQDAANRYVVTINTMGHQLLIQDRDDKVLISSDPFYITMNDLFEVMSSQFKSLYRGCEYRPEKIRNSDLPDMVIISSQEGDWEAIYIHGVSVLQDHRINRSEFTNLVLEHRMELIDILELEASDEDDQNLRSNGTFPDKLEFLLTEYHKDGTTGESDVVELCGFDQAWVGPCKKAVVPGGDRCRDHINVKCRCGKPATHTCEHTMGAFVCGAPLCGSCRCNH